MKKLWIFGFLSLALVGCQSKTEDFAPHIRGEILTLSQTGNISGLYVESIDESSEIKAASVTLNEETLLLNESDKKIKFETLEEGMIVDIELGGEILETYPVQGIATIVRLVSVDKESTSSKEEKTEISTPETEKSAEKTSDEQVESKTEETNFQTEESTDSKEESVTEDKE